MGNAISGQRSLGPEDRSLLGAVTLLLLGFALFAGYYPAVIGWTVAVVAGWGGFS